MRVLYLSDVYFPRVNGVSTSIATFRDELVARGVAVDLVAPSYPGATAGPGISRVRGLRVPFDPEDRIAMPRTFRRAVAALPPADVVHVHTPFAAHAAGVAIARRRSIPLIETYHTDFEQYFEHYVPFLPARWLRSWARRRARRQGSAVDRLVVPSSALARVLGRYGVTAPISVVPTGVRVESFARGDGARFRARHGIAPGRRVLVHVGRLGFEKNVGFLLRAMVEVTRARPETLLVVAGEGPARPALEREAVALGLSPSQILWLGYLDRAGDLPDCYRAGDAFVFASKTETQGLVLLEAMASGVPVVALAERGTEDLLLEQRGALVAFDDPLDFAAKCLTLLADPLAAHRLGEEGLRVAGEWSAARMAERMEGIYRELVARRAVA